MAHTPAINFSFDFLPKRSQYRFRIMYYDRAGYIHCWYYYTSGMQTWWIDVARQGGLNFLHALVIVFFIVGALISATIILAIPIALIYGAITMQ